MDQPAWWGGQGDVVDECRRLFDRTLAAWARDVLALRQAGLHRIRWIDSSDASADAALDAVFD